MRHSAQPTNQRIGEWDSTKGDLVCCRLPCTVSALHPPNNTCQQRRVIFELIWRDFFKFFALKHGNRIFFQEGVVPRGGAKWRSDADAFARWRDGKTGWPLVDANMRELKATGMCVDVVLL